MRKYPPRKTEDEFQIWRLTECGSEFVGIKETKAEALEFIKPFPELFIKHKRKAID